MKIEYFMENKQLYRQVPLELPNEILFSLFALEPVRFNDLHRSTNLSKPLFSKWLRWLIKERLVKRHRLGKQNVAFTLTRAMKKSQEDFDENFGSNGGYVRIEKELEKMKGKKK